MKKLSLLKSLSVVLAGVAVLSSAGCATTKTADSGPVFFPPDPNPPRVQYLTSISSSTDVQAAKGGGISSLLFGEDESEVEKLIVKPYGILTRGTVVYLCDVGQGRVIKIDLAQKKFDFLKGDHGAGKLRKPVAIALDQEGHIFVADTFRKDVAEFDADGNYVKSYGRGVAANPVGVAADAEFLYILDNRSNSIYVIDRNADQVVREIGKTGNKDDSIALPTSLTLDDKGLLHVTNMLSGRLLTFDRDGHLMRGFGKVGDNFGAFSRPRGVFVDPDDGITYVVDAGHQNVQMFNESGRILMFFGDPGLPKGSLNLPAGVSVSKESVEFFRSFVDPDFDIQKIIFVTNQFGNDKISVYGFGQTKSPQKYAKTKPLKPATSTNATKPAEKNGAPAPQGQQTAAEQAAAPAQAATPAPQPAQGL